jgi:ASC-1-like (ASCH) protein
VTHDLKTEPEYFEALRVGVKNFEIRRNDRYFHVGDVLVLREFIPTLRQYTGGELRRVVTYVTDYEQKPGFVVMSLGVVA